jgi:hypothetical protein
MPVAAIRYASPASVPKDVPAYAALSYPTGSRVPDEVKRLEGGLYLPTESIPADRRKVGVVQYLPGDTIPADMRRVILVRSGSVAYSAAVLADSPVGWWRLNQAAGTTGANSVLDSSGNTNHGTPAGGVTFGVAGALAAELDGTSDTAASFDGSDDLVSVADSPSLAFTTTITVEAWVYPTSAGFREIVTKVNGAFTTGWDLGFDASRFPVWHPRAGGFAGIMGANALPLNQWHHLVATCDGTNARLYVNGALAAGPTAFSGSLATSDALRIASHGSGNRFLGRIDEAAVYATALGAARAAAHYAAGTGR